MTVFIVISQCEAYLRKHLRSPTTLSIKLGEPTTQSSGFFVPASEGLGMYKATYM